MGINKKRMHEVGVTKTIIEQEVYYSLNLAIELTELYDHDKAAFDTISRFFTRVHNRRTQG